MLAAAVLFALTTAAALAPAATALDPTIPAPPTRLSADGRTATDGQRSLTVSTVTSISSAGATLSVAGTGYDTFKGIYVAFCVIPPTNQSPTPCGGGADMTGASGASHWISSNPPPQGVGLATPYGPNGSFHVTLTVSPTIGPPGGTPIDCRRVRCAVVTRNDHTRSSDRGQDVFVPITFAASDGSTGGSTGTPTTAPAATSTPPPTIAPTTEAPATSVTPTTAPPTSVTASDGGQVADEQAISETSDPSSQSSRAPWLIVGAVLVAVAAVGVGLGLVARRRSQAAP